MSTEQPLLPNSPDLKPDHEYCSVTIEGMGEYQEAWLEFYGHRQTTRRKKIAPYEVEETEEKLVKDGWQSYARRITGYDHHISTYYVRPKP